VHTFIFTLSVIEIEVVKAGLIVKEPNGHLADHLHTAALVSQAHRPAFLANGDRLLVRHIFGHHEWNLHLLIRRTLAWALDFAKIVRNLGLTLHVALDKSSECEIRGDKLTQVIQTVMNSRVGCLAGPLDRFDGTHD
jgi:hypothetical protein